MNNFTKFTNASTNKERERNDAKFLEQCLNKAEQITEDSSQRDICYLMAEIADYLFYKAIFFKDILTHMQQLLSSCIASKCNRTSAGFVKLHNYVSFERDLLKSLNFI